MIPVQVIGHGYLFEPKSRQRLAQEAGHDYCPHCTLAAPMQAEGVDRPFPGSQAFAEPGTAPSVTLVMDGHTTPFGVCGTEKLGDNDYNIPGVAWGDEIVAQYKQGEVVDVSWCVNADHGGVYGYRLCDDPELVAKFWGDEPLTPEEQVQAEACFNEGLLRCDDVPGQVCGMEPRCQEGWGCDVPGEWFHCEGTSNYQSKSYACANSEESCNGGILVKRQIKIPDTFPVGKTVMSWRWDSDETVEVFAACADIEILPGDFSPTFSPTTHAPTTTKAPTTVLTPEPTSKPTDDTGGVCCWWSPSPDMCSNCQEWAGKYSGGDDYCAQSQYHCEEKCNGGTWCATGGGGGGGDDKTTMAPTTYMEMYDGDYYNTPTPTPAPDHCASSIPLDTLAVGDFTRNKNVDDMYTVDGCEVDLEKVTWIVFDLDEPHVVTETSTLKFCFQQQSECTFHAIHPTNTATALQGGPIFSVSGNGMKAWDVPIREYAYQSFGEQQCFHINLADHWEIDTEFTHLAFINHCNDASGDHKALWSAVEFDDDQVTAAPTAKNGYTGDDAHCCMMGSCDKASGGCYAPIFAPYYCGLGSNSCTNCGGQYCDASSSSSYNY